MHYMYINRMRERAYLLLTSLRGTATFQGRQRCKKLFCLPSVNGSTLKGKFFFLRMSTFSLLEKRPSQKGFGEQESKQEVAKIVSLEKDGRKSTKCIQSP